MCAVLSFVLNRFLSGLSGAVKTHRVGADEFLEVPARILTEGVLNGSGGAVYYPAEENEKSAPGWVGIPLTLNHPRLGDEYIFVNDPRFDKRYIIGWVSSSEYNQGPVDTKVVFDIGKLRIAEQLSNSNGRIERALKTRKLIELSTGLWALKEEVPTSFFNAKDGPVAYQFVARNYQPDHLAILTDEPGACSVKDGCGVFNNLYEVNMKKQYIDYLIANCSSWGEEDRKVLEGMSEEKLKTLSDGTHQSLLANSALKGFSTLFELNPDTPIDKMVSRVEEKVTDPKTPSPNKGGTEVKVANTGEKTEPKGKTVDATEVKTLVDNALKEALGMDLTETQKTFSHATAILNQHRSDLVEKIAGSYPEADREGVKTQLKDRKTEDLEFMANMAAKLKPEVKQAPQGWDSIHGWNGGTPTPPPQPSSAVPTPPQYAPPGGSPVLNSGWKPSPLKEPTIDWSKPVE